MRRGKRRSIRAEQGARRQDAGTGCGELQGKGDAVQAAADLGDALGVDRVQIEGGVGVAHPVDEKADRRGGGERSQIRGGVGLGTARGEWGGRRQGQDRYLDLAADAEALAAGRQD